MKLWIGHKLVTVFCKTQLAVYVGSILSQVHYNYIFLFKLY